MYTTLSVLALYPGISSAKLARLTFVSPQAANEMVTTLEGKGFLRRSVDRTNRRQLEVTVTRRGQAALGKSDIRVDALEAEMFQHVGVADRAHFHGMLQSCLDTLSLAPS